MLGAVTPTSPQSRALRRRKQPSAGVLRVAAAAGVAPEDLLGGDRAAELAGYVGGDPSRSLAAARRRGNIEGFVDPDVPGGTVWYSRAALEAFRAERLGEPNREAGEPGAWLGDDGNPGAPVGRVEHELELEVERLRERLGATEAERDRLAAELARARGVAAALAQAMAAAVAEPPAS